MSDPVTNVEIEDVLSSIRRLVSAEERGEEADQGGLDEDRPDSRLVLTPAQRVDDAPQNDKAAAPDTEAPDAQAGNGRFDGIEDAEIVEPPHDETPEPAEEDAAEARAADADAGAGEDGGDDDWAIAAEIPDHPDADADAGTGADDGGAEAAATGEIDLKDLKARIAGFESAVAAQDDEWEPDGDPDEEYAAGPVSPLPWQDAGEDATGDLTADPPEEAEPQAPEPDPAQMSWPVEDDEAQAAPDRADAGMAEPEAEEADDDGESGWYSDDAVLDEEALRDMVSEIVRQELQGALGERITRNVRKLVRREIHRALMSQGID